jgi:hypothetical protein
MENGSQRVRFANALYLRRDVKERSNDRCIAAAERIAELERNGAFSNKFLTKVITRPFPFPSRYMQMAPFISLRWEDRDT